ncbi:MAG: hypothetical protein FWF05_06175 [Oscillospiraceae bacterium]|nr:hypothetical protein [Oscillospiraceae bacterium]
MNKILRFPTALLAAALMLFAASLRANAAVTPRVVETLYPTEDVVIAEIIATEDPWSADPAGQSDSTVAIQQAIDDCAAAGGGTVWLPTGEYLLTGQVTVRPFVTLRGDWNPPGGDGGYDGCGAVILANPPSTDAPTPALFYVDGSAGVMGLTVYYPEQRLDQVKPYPFTFYIGRAMLQSVVNCTVINGYRGIGVCVNGGEGHEQMTVENFSGTFLCVGLEAYNQSDVGTLKNVSISPRYWEQAGAGFTCNDPAALESYTRANTAGMILGDLEWTQFANIDIESCETGVRIVKGRRIEFAGAFYNADIRNCGTGILVESIDERWGMVLADSRVEGDVALRNRTKGLVKCCGVEFTGKVKGFYVWQTKLGGLPLTVDYQRAALKPPARLFIVEGDNTGNMDCSFALQQVLDSAGKSGGGVVYLPAGCWLLERPVTVPANVELRGTGTTAQRDQGSSAGTVIYAYPALCDTPAEADAATALITLAGKNAGLRGIRLVCPDSRIFEGIKPGAYLIRGKAEGVYVMNAGILAAWNGIDFRNCDGHFIKRVTGCSFNNMFSVGGTGGMVEGCLQNGNAYYRCNFGFPGWPTDETKIWVELFDPITRPNAEYLRVTGAREQSVLNIFAYGVKTLVASDGSEGTLLVNIGADNLGGPSPLLRVNGGSLTAVNMMRWNGHSYDKAGCAALRVYNRLTIDQRCEFNVPCGIFSLWEEIVNLFRNIFG